MEKVPVARKISVLSNADKCKFVEPGKSNEPEVLT